MKDWLCVWIKWRRVLAKEKSIWRLQSKKHFSKFVAKIHSDNHGNSIPRHFSIWFHHGGQPCWQYRKEISRHLFFSCYAHCQFSHTYTFFFLHSVLYRRPAVTNKYFFRISVSFMLLLILTFNFKFSLTLAFLFLYLFYLLSSLNLFFSYFFSRSSSKWITYFRPLSLIWHLLS